MKRCDSLTCTRPATHRVTRRMFCAACATRLLAESTRPSRLQAILGLLAIPPQTTAQTAG